MDKFPIGQKFSVFHEAWRPMIVGKMNDSYIRLEKLQGEYDWQHYEDEDELILVVEGRLLMMFHERNVWIEEGEFLVIPRGVPFKRFVPEGICRVVLVEPKNIELPADVFHDKSIAGLEMMG
jgi:mannose-6-phosphate isomerase-like protein (cupin superfamily)